MLYHDYQGIKFDLDANAPEFDLLDDDEPLDEEDIAKGQRRGHVRREKKTGKLTVVRAHTVKDRPKKPEEKPDRIAHALRFEQPAPGEVEWGTIKPKVARRPRKKGAKRAKVRKTITTIAVVAVGALSLTDRKRLFEARLAELGLVREKNIRAAMLTPESKRYLGYYIDMGGEKHPVKVPTGRRVGRPRKGKDQAAALAGESALLTAIREAKPDEDVAPEFVKTVRVIYDEATGSTTLVLPAEMDAFSHTAQAIREREHAWATEIAKHTLPDRPASPTPVSNLDLLLDYVEPAHVRRWVRRDCGRWENVIWQRERSPVRWEVQTPLPKGRPDTRVLVGMYETQRHVRGYREIVVFPAAYSEWHSKDAPPPALAAAGKQTYGQALLKQMPAQERSLLRSALGLAPLFGDEKDAALAAINAGKPLAGSHVVGLALGLASLERVLTFNYWQAQARGDDDHKAWHIVQRGHLARLAMAWMGLRLPGRERATVRHILSGLEKVYSPAG